MAGPDLTALQKRVMKYWVLAFLALMGSMLVAMAATITASFAFGIQYDHGNNDRDITLATLALASLLWLPALFWALGRARCLQCKRSLMPFLWSTSYDFAQGRWVTTVPDRCPACGDNS